MTKASENVFPKVRFSEETAPATPPTGEAVVYVKSDGKLYLKDDAGTETDLTASGGSSIAESAKASRDTTVQSISDITNTAVSFETEEWDDNALIDLGTQATRITIQTTGKYLISGNTIWAANTTGIRFTTIMLNGTTQLANQVTAPTVSTGQRGQGSASVIASLSATDYLELVVYQSSGGALDLSADARNHLSVARVA